MSMSVPSLRGSHYEAQMFMSSHSRKDQNIHSNSYLIRKHKHVSSQNIKAIREHQKFISKRIAESKIFFVGQIEECLFHPLFHNLPIFVRRLNIAVFVLLLPFRL